MTTEESRKFHRMKFRHENGYCDWKDHHKKANNIRWNHICFVIPCIFFLYNILFVLSKWSSMFTEFSVAGLIFWICFIYCGYLLVINGFMMGCLHDDGKNYCVI